MTAVFVCWTAASAVFANSKGENHAAAAAVVAMIFIYYLFYNAQHVLVFTYTTEVRIKLSIPSQHLTTLVAIRYSLSFIAPKE